MINKCTSKGNFFCLLGLPKCGTTWLAEYLRASPAIYIPPVKELQLFSRRFRPDLYRWMDSLFQRNLINTIRNLDKNTKNTDASIELVRLLTEIYSMPLLADDHRFIDHYRKLFVAVSSDDLLSFGEMSTTYCTLHEQHLQLLDSCFADTKYIVILRDPKTRLWSHIKHKARFFDSDPVRDLDRWLADKEISEINEYRHILNKVFSVIPRERVMIVFYEALFYDDKNETLKSLCNFLDIEYVDANKANKIYVSNSQNLPDGFSDKLKIRTADNYNFVQQLVGYTPDNWEY